jgi:hypothetical protein
MSNFSDPSPQPPGWSSNDFRESALSPATAHRDRGLIGHVPLVAVLLIVQGALELLFALFGIGFTLLVYFGPQKELGGLRGVAILLAVAGGLSLSTGLLRVVAGLFNLRYRRRGLGLIALAAGLLTMVTAYCAPTGIALAVYGLIVYLNESVIAAFTLGDRGRSPAQIREAFPPPQ